MQKRIFFSGVSQKESIRGPSFACWTFNVGSWFFDGLGIDNSKRSEDWSKALDY
jgi:hypothetical protein